MTNGHRAHWDSVHSDKSFTDVSWYQETPDKSLELIAATGIAYSDAIIDAGGGVSTLVDHLLERGYSDLTILDISANALQQARDRLAGHASQINWLVDDVTRFSPERQYALWHDRAVLHFLVDEDDRERYASVVHSAVSHGGHLVLATFGPDGPERCSGLATRRYNVEMTAELLGSGFELREFDLEYHETPGGVQQQFLYSAWRKS
jgi:trans-aconitate methyltransferase